MNTPEEKKTSVQFFVDDEEAAAIRDITKVDALGPASLSIVRKAIEAHNGAKKA